MSDFPPNIIRNQFECYPIIKKSQLKNIKRFSITKTSCFFLPFFIDKYRYLMYNINQSGIGGEADDQNEIMRHKPRAGC